MGELASTNPRTGEPTGWTVTETTEAELDAACRAAARAAPVLAATSRQVRATWLRAMSAALADASQELVAAADQETGLGVPRLAGELVRSCFQLDLFADVLEDGGYLEATIDHATQTAMGPRPDLRRMLVPLGPVGVFGASNFPFAFSVPGGDTASALAAGCPVVVKAHPLHAQTSQRAFEVMSGALDAVGAPAGTLAIVHGVTAGAGLVAHPDIRAVGFTGSSGGGRALDEIARSRPDPIPFYGELSGLNPLVVTPSAADARGDAIAAMVADAIVLGGGQFCTKPGLVLVPLGHAGDALQEALARELETRAPVVALGRGIADTYRTGVEDLAACPGAEVVARSAQAEPAAGSWMTPTVLAVPAESLEGRLLEECFGPLVVVVRYADEAAAVRALRAVRGSLTATIHAEPDDDVAQRLAVVAGDISGRLVWNGVPTGVGVGWGMQHGGPSPSTTSSLHTSVGPTAIRRFLRPVTWQNAPEGVLPPELRDGERSLPRRVDGSVELALSTAPQPVPGG